MTDALPVNECCEVPLSERLRAIPVETRLGIPLDWTLGTTWHAVGRDAHLAADEIDRLSAENAALRKALERIAAHPVGQLSMIARAALAGAKPCP